MRDARTPTPGIRRRDAIRRLASGALGAASAPLWVEQLGAFARQQADHAHAAIAASAQAATTWAPKTLSPQQLQTVGILSELIIPQTATPGAAAALVDRFIDEVLTEAPATEREAFLKGLTWADARSTALFGKNVVTATANQRTDLLTRLAAAGSSEAPAGIAFFNAIKSLTITGYYTSEIGLRQELGDDGILAQGSFQGCTHPEHQI